MSEGVKAAVVVFPGSLSHCAWSWETITGQKADLIWHKETSIPDYDLVIIPSGVSFGNYLRPGAIAAHSPVMSEIKRLAKRGSRILGISNGFQILTEAGLLPGSFLPNQCLTYICKDTFLKIENNRTDFTSSYQAAAVVRLPIGHDAGRFTIDYSGLAKLKDNQQIVLRYCQADGSTKENSAPDGSLDNIAAVINETGNVMGLMPQPERLSEQLLGGEDGRMIFESLALNAGDRK